MLGEVGMGERGERVGWERLRRWLGGGVLIFFLGRMEGGRSGGGGWLTFMVCIVGGVLGGELAGGG